MSDGPFKNMKLGQRWKRFADAVQGDAFDCVECCNYASDAILHEILTSEFQGLLADYQTYSSGNQLGFDPLATIEGLFDRHKKSPMTDILQKEIMFRVGQQVAPGEALQPALAASLNRLVGVTKSRFEEECIRVCEAGDIGVKQFRRTVSQLSETFERVDQGKLCDAILASNKKAFKAEVSKKNRFR